MCWLTNAYYYYEDYEVYVKLFTSLYAGSLRGKSDCILVFTNMLAHADSTGIVDIHPRAIAEEVGLSAERVRAAIAELESEDHDSRSPEENGKRLILLDKHRDWGWNIVNFLKYRTIRNEDERREQNRLAQERWRSKQSKQSKHGVMGVSTVSQSKPMQKQKQKQERERAHPKNINEVKAYWTEKQLRGDPESFFDHFEARGWISGKTKIKDWQRAANNWSRNESKHVEITTEQTDEYLALHADEPRVEIFYFWWARHSYAYRNGPTGGGLLEPGWTLSHPETEKEDRIPILKPGFSRDKYGRAVKEVIANV